MLAAGLIFLALGGKRSVNWLPLSVTTRARGRVHLARAVRLVFASSATLPLPDGLPSEVVEPCQFGLGKRGGADFLTDQVSGAGLPVQGLGY